MRIVLSCCHPVTSARTVYSLSDGAVLALPAKWYLALRQDPVPSNQ